MSETAGGPQGYSTDLRDLPKALWVGVVVGVLGFFVSISSHSEHIVNGTRTSCSYTDYGALIAAVVCIGAAGAAWVARGRERLARRPATWLMAAGSVLLVVLAAVHVLRGLGVVGGPCN